MSISFSFLFSTTARSTRRSNSSTGRDRWCLWELAFSQSASFQIIKHFHELNPDSIRKRTYSRSLIQLAVQNENGSDDAVELFLSLYSESLCQVNSHALHVTLQNGAHDETS
jgi:hypothetical protein